jgi:hypothetical protein
MATSVHPAVIWERSLLMMMASGGVLFNHLLLLKPHVVPCMLPTERDDIILVVPINLTPIRVELRE